MFKARVTVPLKEINLFQLQQVYINLYTWGNNGKVYLITYYYLSSGI
jgi:hypothetical protein